MGSLDVVMGKHAVAGGQLPMNPKSSAQGERK